MPVDKRPIAFRTSFDQVAGDYDAVRPGYPPALIDDIVTLAALPPQARILEVGCGTGQATLPFAQRGYELICLDIGASLLAIAERKFASYPNVHFQQAAFEAWPAEPMAFDLVMSATAFHWIPPEIGYPKAAHVLKDTGSLAIFANEHIPSGTGFIVDVHQLEQRLVPGWPDPSTAPTLDIVIAATATAIDATHLFEPVIVKTYPWACTYTAPEYLRLLNTYSNYRNLQADIRARLFDSIADRIEQKYGGSITKQYVAVLHLAKKRPSTSERVEYPRHPPFRQS